MEFLEVFELKFAIRLGDGILTQGGGDSEDDWNVTSHLWPFSRIVAKRLLDHSHSKSLLSGMVRRGGLSLGLVLLFLSGWAVGARLASVEAVVSMPTETATGSEATTESLESLVARVESAPLSEFRAIYQELSNSGNANLDRLTARRALLKRWIREDASLLDSLEVQTQFNTSESLKEFTQVWLETDASAFFVWMARQERFLGEQVRTHAALIAPLDLIAQAGKTPQRPPEWDSQIATALLAVADKDSTKAMALFRSMDLPENLKGIRFHPGDTSWYTSDDLPLNSPPFSHKPILKPPSPSRAI